MNFELFLLILWLNLKPFLLNKNHHGLVWHGQIQKYCFKVTNIMCYQKRNIHNKSNSDQTVVFITKWCWDSTPEISHALFPRWEGTFLIPFMGFRLFAALFTDRWKPVNVAVAAGHAAVIVTTCKHYQSTAVINFCKSISRKLVVSVWLYNSFKAMIKQYRAPKACWSLHKLRKASWWESCSRLPLITM